MAIHLLFDLIAALTAVGMTWAAYRWRLAAAAARIERSGIGYAAAPVLGAAVGGFGFGTFNLVEGTISHHILGLHHVNETVSREYWAYWDFAFLAWGAAMLLGGLLLLRTGSLMHARSGNTRLQADVPRSE